MSRTVPPTALPNAHQIVLPTAQQTAVPIAQGVQRALLWTVPPAALPTVQLRLPALVAVLLPEGALSVLQVAVHVVVVHVEELDVEGRE